MIINIIVIKINISRYNTSGIKLDIYYYLCFFYTYKRHICVYIMYIVYTIYTNLFIIVLWGKLMSKCVIK